MANKDVPKLLTLDGDWFLEKHHTFPGQTFGLEVEKLLFHEKSKYQDVVVFESKTYGRVMVLDGIVNSTSRDEHSYQEMIAFLPLNSHPDPKQVLIIGGGDGGVARECAKHPKVEAVTMVEIDQVVIDASKIFLPKMAVGMNHPKVTVLVEDGLEFLKNTSETYDVIIADLSDPDGPAEQLFQETFYKHMKACLKPDGIVCTQGESIWLDLELIDSMITFCKSLYPSVSFAYNNVPTYTSGCIGYLICSQAKDKTFNDPIHIFTDAEKDEMELLYYDEDVHRAAFVLPRFAKKKLDL